MTTMLVQRSEMSLEVPLPLFNSHEKPVKRTLPRETWRKFASVSIETVAPRGIADSFSKQIRCQGVSICRLGTYAEARLTNPSG
jgi:hypothetical protein